MKKYALYSWRVDDDGGWGVCYYHDFNTGLHPFVKCCDWCKPEPSKLICGFDTAEEAANVVYDPDDDYYTKEEIIEEIQSLLDDFLLANSSDSELFVLLMISTANDSSPAPGRLVPLIISSANCSERGVSASIVSSANNCSCSTDYFVLLIISTMLDGLTHTELTSVPFKVGFETEDYIIVSVEEV